MKTTKFLLLICCALATITACNEDDSFTPTIPGTDIDPKDYATNITNPYYPLTPGTTLYYVNTSVEEGDTTIENVEVAVTQDTKEIMGVTCRVVHDVATDEEGNVQEDTYDWYAQDKDGNVWYFGENTKAYDNGSVSTEGSWEAGVDGAAPGIVMYADPLAHKGRPYYQEYYPDVAVDQAVVLDAGNRVEVPYGNFSNTLRIKEYSALEPEVVENKYYVAGLGFVLAKSVKGANEREELVRITH
ncbi:hypothetical protein [Pontibacter chitinilyticus]|uniref:hypothetical protein n=1 Tax=Pontibacter chitinilyticus TaxID=2674989 RepID=UPI00321A0AE5